MFCTSLDVLDILTPWQQHTYNSALVKQLKAVMNEYKKIWLRNMEGNWRDVECPCGSSFHFEGSIEALFSWERTHIRHMSFDSDNHDMLSFYPKDMVIFYHSKSGYVVEKRRHRKDEIRNLKDACTYGTIKLAGV